jgi:hypothetical protein
MALQDLTPQLRTRLSRMERAVGWFVAVAVGLLIFGFGYYVYNTAQRKGWFKTKAPYYTFAERATGLKVGDPVQMMGLNVGQIVELTPMGPYDPYNIFVRFEIVSPNYGYLWTEGSRAKFNTADLLGKRVLEVTKGTNGYPTYVFHPLRSVSLAEAESLDPARWLCGEEVLDSGGNHLAKPLQKLTNLAALRSAGVTNLVVLDRADQKKEMTGVWNDRDGRYEPYTKGVTKGYWLVSDESAAVTERLEKLVSDVEQALPNILGLTNQLTRVLTSSADLTSNLNVVAVSARPAVSNIILATAGLGERGALGERLFPTNINRQLEATLASAEVALTTANTNLATLAQNLNRSLESLAAITANLNQQVEANTNLVKAVSDSIIHADQFIQGLKRHWLFRSAFKEKKPASPSPPPSDKVQSPKAASE